MSIKLDRGFYATALRLAIPIALQNLLVSCASLIDTSMVMTLGNAATSAMGIASRFAFMLNVVSFGVSSGASALISQYWGAREYKEIKKVYGLSLTFAMAIAVIFAVALFLFPVQLMHIFNNEDAAVISAGADYLKYYAFAIIFVMFSQISCAALRATESVVLPLVSSGVSVCANTFLNYCLINGNFGFPRLEMKGAAIATAIGACVQALVVLLYVIFANNAIRGRLRDMFGYTRDFVKVFVRVASPVLANEALWAVGTNIYVMVIARQGTENHAGYTVYDTFQQVFFVFFVGICNASAIMVGKRVGEGRRDQAFLAARRFVIMTPLVGVVVGAAMILLRSPILGILPIETAGAELVASRLLFNYGLWLPIKMISYTAICGVFRAGGDTFTGFLHDILSLYLVGVPTVVALGLFTEIPFVWLVFIMYVAEDVPKTFLTVRHFFSRKWIKSLVGSDNQSLQNNRSRNEKIQYYRDRKNTRL